MAEPIYTVEEINLYLKSLLENDPVLARFWLKGELSNFVSHSSGHWYFTIKDHSGSLRCVMFRSRSGRVRFRPENGKKVMVLGYISLYEKGGQYQLYAQEMVEDGIGDLYEQYEQLKKKLTEEGLFEESRKRGLPFFPKKVGVVTSPTGAAVRDIITVIRRRMPGTEILLVPALVQGTGSRESLVSALDSLYQSGVEVIIIGRGGGSIEELWSFNEEMVVRKIVESPVPVISAVGHETDFTLSDFAADVRAATPSQAAELAVPSSRELLDILEQRERRLRQSLERQLGRKQERLESLLSRRIFENPEKIWEAKSRELEWLSEKLEERILRILQDKHRRVDALAQNLDLLSPLKILSRGYAVAFDSRGRVLSDSGHVEKGEEISLTLHKGSLICTVKEKPKRDK